MSAIDNHILNESKLFPQLSAPSASNNFQWKWLSKFMWRTHAQKAIKYIPVIISFLSIRSQNNPNAILVCLLQRVPGRRGHSSESSWDTRILRTSTFSEPFYQGGDLNIMFQFQSNNTNLQEVCFFPAHQLMHEVACPIQYVVVLRRPRFHSK